jgi:hypothetical protein
MYNELVSLTPRKHLNPKRRFAGESITWVRLKVVNCKNKGVATQKGEGQVEPEVGALVMDHVWCESVDFLE